MINQPELFHMPITDNGAVFSECRQYRYALWRIWDASKPHYMFIGLNPSTANEHENDPTIKRVIKLCKNWGGGGLYMMNCYPYVSTDPKKLVLSTAEHNQQNDFWLYNAAKRCQDIIFCWGAFKQAHSRAEEIKAMFPQALALHINADRSPKHPLYVRATTVPIKYFSENQKQ